VSSPFIGEIRLFGGNFAPAGWAFCDGSIIPISENDTLFNLIGTTYGGDGQSTFALPDLRGRVPIHMGTGPGGVSFVLGELSGAETVTLTPNQIPVHTHSPVAATSAGPTNPANAVWGYAAQARSYAAPPPDGNMDPATVRTSGGSQPHENMMPFLGVNFIISLFGIFPSQ
jgi:microcystin-dependent protein